MESQSPTIQFQMLSLFQPQRRSSLPVIQADLAAQLADLHELGLCLVDGGGTVVYPSKIIEAALIFYYEISVLRLLRLPGFGRQARAAGGHSVRGARRDSQEGAENQGDNHARNMICVNTP